MTTTVEPFTDTSGTNIQSRVSPVIPFVKHPQSGTPNLQISAANRCRQANTSGTALYYADIDPDSADYGVSVTLTRLSGDTTTLGVTARTDETDATFYHARVVSGTELVQLYKSIAGTLTQLGSDVHVIGLFPSDGSTRKLTIDCDGTTIRALLDDVEKISVTDSSITAAGHPGLRSNTPTTGENHIHFDDFTVVDSGSEGVTATIGQAIETDTSHPLVEIIPDPWTFVASSTASRTSAGALNPGMPTGWAPGDWLIAVAQSRPGVGAAGDLPAPAGWKLRDTRARGTGGRVWLFTRKASATNGTSFTIAGSPNPFSLAIIAIRPHGHQVSYDTLTASSGSASAQTVPALTPGGAGELLVHIAVAAIAGTSGGYTWDSAATEILDYSAADSTAAAVATISAAIEDGPDSGASDSLTATYSGAASYVTYTVALSPTLEPLGQAMESDSARTIKTGRIGQAREQFVAHKATAVLTPSSPVVSAVIGQAVEADSAHGLVVIRVIGRAVEHDLAHHMGTPGDGGSKLGLMGVG